MQQSYGKFFLCYCTLKSSEEILDSFRAAISTCKFFLSFSFVAADIEKVKSLLSEDRSLINSYDKVNNWISRLIWIGGLISTAVGLFPGKPSGRWVSSQIWRKCKFFFSQTGLYCPNVCWSFRFVTLSLQFCRKHWGCWTSSSLWGSNKWCKQYR